MMPAPPQPTPAPIHDIADGIMVRLLSPAWLPFWMAAALALLALIGLVFWLTRRKRTSPPPTPRQSALAALEQLRREGPEADPYSFGVKISDALRAYIRDQHGLDAVTRTSVEFLEALRENRAFTINEKEALSEFLESVDLLKYARLSAAAADIESLLAIAERLVRGQNAMPASAAK
ncbi:MAG TPA: DUF4381 family protein [Terrimicrobiaceae bacterium]